MSPTPQQVSVVIPARPRGEPYLEEALGSALGESPLEVVVVAAGGGDSAALGRAHSARVVDAGTENPPTKRNRGAEQARGAVLAFLDADDLFPAGRMAPMLSALGDAVTGTIRTFLSPDVREELAGRVKVDPDPRPGLLSGALVIRREAFLSLGGFREDLFTGETADLRSRAERAALSWTELDLVSLERRIHGGEHFSRTRLPEIQRDYLRLARERIEGRSAS